MTCLHIVCNLGFNVLLKDRMSQVSNHRPVITEQIPPEPQPLRIEQDLLLGVCLTCGCLTKVDYV